MDWQSSDFKACWIKKRKLTKVCQKNSKQTKKKQFIINETVFMNEGYEKRGIQIDDNGMQMNG